MSIPSAFLYIGAKCGTTSLVIRCALIPPPPFVSIRERGYTNSEKRIAMSSIKPSPFGKIWLHRYMVTSLHRYIVTSIHRYITISLHNRMIILLYYYTSFMLDPSSIQIIYLTISTTSLFLPCSFSQQKQN